MSRALVAQAESEKAYDALGTRFGYEVYDVNGYFELVIHTSTYEGVRRASHFAAPSQSLDAMTREEAVQEAARKTAAYARAVLGLETLS